MVHTNGKSNGLSPALESFTPNPALYTSEKNDLEVRESPPLQPKETDCVVHVHTNGICGCVYCLTLAHIDSQLT